MARLRQRGGISAGLSGAAGGINDFLQHKWSQDAIEARQQQLAKLQHLQGLETYKMEHPNPAIMDEITKNPETTSPELVRQSLMNASRNGAPNVPGQQNDQSQWGLKGVTSAAKPAEGQIASTQIKQTTPFTEMVDQSLNTLNAQKAAKTAEQTRAYNSGSPNAVKSIGANGEEISTPTPMGVLPGASVGATDQQAAARKQAEAAAAKVGNRDTPEDVSTAATKAAAVASAENPALAARAAAAANAQEAATTPRRTQENATAAAAKTKEQQLHALDQEEQAIQPQAAEMLKDTGDDPQAITRVSVWVMQRRAAVDKKRRNVIMGIEDKQPAVSAPAAATTAAKVRRYNPATGKLE